MSINKFYNEGILSRALTYARHQFDKLTDTRDFDARYLARRRQTPEHRCMMLDLAQLKRERKNAKRLVDAEKRIVGRLAKVS